METLQNPQTEQLSLDAELSQQEVQKAAQIELMNSLEVPDELESLRHSSQGEDDATILEGIKIHAAEKLRAKEDADYNEDQGINSAKLKESYGDDVITNLRNFYLDYITMPQDKFDQRMKELKEVQSDKGPNTEEKQQSGVYGLKGSELVNRGIDIVGEAPAEPKADFDIVDPDAGLPVKVEDELSSEAPHPEYDGPVKKGAELAPVPSKELAPVDEDQASSEVELLPGEADVADGEEDESSDRRSVRDRIRDRWNSIRVRTNLLSQGDVRGALGNEEGELLSKKRMIGAAVVAGAVLVAWQGNKNGWGMDMLPFIDGSPDGVEGADGIVAGPTGGEESIADEAARQAQVAEMLSEIENPVLAGEGTSHLAKRIGIDFGNDVERWNAFNSLTNHLFEGLEGTYSQGGTVYLNEGAQISPPQEVIEQMLKIAKEV